MNLDKDLFTPHSVVVFSNMLPDAVMPPSQDHTYAQWLQRETLPTSPQPSPYKKVSAAPVRALKVIPMGKSAVCSSC